MREHIPALQKLPAAHSIPHAPQLRPSFWTLTQRVPQSSVGTSHSSMVPSVPPSIPESPGGEPSSPQADAVRASAREIKRSKRIEGRSYQHPGHAAQRSPFVQRSLPMYHHELVRFGASGLALAVALSGCGLVLGADGRPDDGFDGGRADGGSDSSALDARGDTAADAPTGDAVIEVGPQGDAATADAGRPMVASCDAPAPLATFASRTTIDGRQLIYLADTTVGAPNGTEPLTCSCESGFTGGERVYEYTTPGPGRVEIDTYGTSDADTGFDTSLYVRTPCTDGGSELACDDTTDHDTRPGRSQVYLRTDAPETLDIIVDSCAPEGDFGLAVRFEPEGVSGTCANPIAIEPSAGTTARAPLDLRATLDHGEPPGCNYCTVRWGRGNDLVFAYTAPDAGRYQMTVRSAEFDAIVHVRRECNSPSTELACDDDALDPDARVVIDLAAGETVYVFADTCRAWHRGLGELEIRPLSG